MSTTDEFEAFALSPTANPCPAWCGQELGHPYDSELGGEVYRSHELSLGSVGDVQALVVADDTARSDESAPHVSGPKLMLWAPDAMQIRPDQAEQMAAMLVDAAARFRTIVGQ